MSVWLVLSQPFWGGPKKYVGLISSIPTITGGGWGWVGDKRSTSLLLVLLHPMLGVQISFFSYFLYLFLWSLESTFLWSADSVGAIVSPSEEVMSKYGTLVGWWLTAQNVSTGCGILSKCLFVHPKSSTYPTFCVEKLVHCLGHCRIGFRLDVRI